MAPQQAAPKEEELKEKVLEAAEEHPAYGHRRIQAEPADRHGLKAKHKKLRRLLSERDLAFIVQEV